MFKQLLSDNRIFGAMVCVLVFIAGGLIYLQTVKHQATQDIQRTQKIVEQRSTPQTGEVAPQLAPGGHYHPDGTYHVGPHETESATTPTPPQPGATQADITARTWTGQPLRETSSPDLLSLEERKARDAKIQKLTAEYEALKRVSQPLTTQVMKLQEEREEISRKQEELIAEIDVIRANENLSAQEKECLEAENTKQFNELSDLSKAKGDKSKALNAEEIMLVEKQGALLEELQALRRKRRKSE